MYWEGTYLHIVISNNSGKDVFLRSQHRPLIPFKQREVLKDGSNRQELVLNITTAHDRSFPENGKWEIGQYSTSGVPEEDLRYKPQKREEREDLFNFCAVSSELADKLQNLGRVFRYNGLRYAYTIDFTVYTLDDETMHLNVCSLFMMKNDKYRKRRYFFEARSLKERIKKFIAAFKRGMMTAAYRTFRVFHRADENGNNILLFTEVQESINGNLLAVYSKLREMHLDERFDVKISARKAVGKKNGSRSWLAVIKKLAWADYIFVDNYIPLFDNLVLSSDTQLIQLWHAGVGFKSVGYSRFGKKGSPNPVRHAHRRYTRALAPSKKLIPVYAELFGIEEEAFIPVGLPRFDTFFDQAKAETFKESFYREHPELEDKKIILFAPTFRGKGQKTAYYNYSKLDFRKIAEFCGDDYVFALKMHPFIVNDTQEYYEECCTKNSDISLSTQQRLLERRKPDLDLYGGKIIDLTSGYDINDLFHISEILITDYSSAYYEFSVQRKPILFYTYDRQIYENVRGVHQSIKEFAPGKVCDTFDVLLEALQHKDFELEKTIKFADENFSEDPALRGKATERLIETVLLAGEETNEGSE